jgi:hypothetical protein
MSAASKPLQFIAEVKSAASKKTASNDVGYTVVLHTDDPGAMSLGLLDGDTLVNVTVEISK